MSIGDSLFIDDDQFGDAFIAVYDEDGGLKWARQLKTDGGGVTAVRLDSSGDLYVGGQIDGGGTFVDLGGHTIVKSPGALHSDEFLGRYDAKGGLTWWEQISGSGSMSVSDIDIDKRGNLYVAGTLKGSVTIGRSEYSSYSDADGIVARLDASIITSVEPERPRRRHESRSPFPNPTSRLAMLGVMLARDEPVSVRLYDLSGRLVRDYQTVTLATGPRYVTIDGAGLPGGRYLYRVSTSSGEMTGVVVLTH